MSIHDNKLKSLLDDIDPNLNFYNDFIHQASSLRKYFTEDSFNDAILQTSGEFSMIHHNIRSMSANFSSLINYLQCLTHTF